MGVIRWLVVLACACGSEHTKTPPPPQPAPRDAWELPMVDAPPHVVLTITATDVVVEGKSVGAKPMADDLQDKVAAALANAHAKILVIEGASSETSALTINAITNGAHMAGFDQVLIGAH